MSFRNDLSILSREHCRRNKLPDIVTIMDVTPNYAVDVSAAMTDMILGGKGGKSSGDAGAGGDEKGYLEDLDGFSMESDEEHTDDAKLFSEEEDDDDDDFVLI